MAYSGKVNIQQAMNDSPFRASLGHYCPGFSGPGHRRLRYGGDGLYAPTLSADWGIKKQDLGPVLSAALLGLSFGALLAGPISDRMGRKRVLVFSCLFLASPVWELPMPRR
jgi:AAHS family 4-hydroxybenzoate transporter-like MFS transporter